jgi:hypothetical protein
VDAVGAAAAGVGAVEVAAAHLAVVVPWGRPSGGASRVAVADRAMLLPDSVNVAAEYFER